MQIRYDIVTLFPEMFSAVNSGVIGRAINRGIIGLNFWNPRDYAKDSYRKVDDSPYGGGPGMVMLVKPLRDAICAAKASGGEMPLVVYMTPQGRLLNQQVVDTLASKKNMIIVCGRYEGIDERLFTLEPGLELSIGDYVLSGGEPAAMVVIDAVTRQLDGVVGDVGSVANESFITGILDYPQYTRPEVVDGCSVPEVLLGGDHAKISRWRRKEALGRTWLRRPAMLEKIELTAGDRMLLNEFIEETK